jgi:hypothetical protein
MLSKRARSFSLYIQYMQQTQMDAVACERQENELELRHMPYLCLLRKRYSAKKTTHIEMRGVFERVVVYTIFPPSCREGEVGKWKEQDRMMQQRRQRYAVKSRQLQVF